MGTRLGSLVALVVLALAALVSATYDGPVWESQERESQPAGTVPEQPPEQPREGTELREREGPEPDDQRGVEDIPGTAPAALLVLLLAIAAVVGVAIALRLHLVRRRRRLSGDRTPRLGGTPEPGPETEDEDLAELDEHLDAALTELEEGEPRNAIVAIWLHLERLLHGDRFERHPEDTPTEFADRARASYRLDGAALDELAGLYREARFSEHPLTAGHRDRARACLLRLRADLRGVAPWS